MSFVESHLEIILVVVAVIVFGFMTVRIIRKAHKIDREGIETDAVVTRMEIHYDPDTASDTYTYYAQYTDENNEIREAPFALTTSEEYETGSVIRIRYIPGEHELVRPVKNS